MNDPIHKDNDWELLEYYCLFCEVHATYTISQGIYNYCHLSQFFIKSLILSSCNVFDHTMTKNNQ